MRGGLALTLLAPGLALAQDAYPGSKLAPPDLAAEARVVIAQPRRMPRRALRYELARDGTGERVPEPWVVLLGEMAFHSPRLLGPKAAFHEVSCNACHPNGGNNPEVEFEESYGVKGRIDLTTSYFSLNAEDGIRNARRIPSLRGVRFTAPYTAEGRTQGLKEQVRNVIVVEFGNPEPPDYLLDALVRFLEQLDPLPNPLLDGRGRLTAAASPAAHRGEKAFLLPRAELDGASCGGCHVPDRGFLDGASHDIQGERWNTPSLRGLDSLGVYFHDASARTLGDALAGVERRFGLRLGAEERADLLAYLVSGGAEEAPWEELPRSARLARAVSFLPLVLDRESPYRDQRAVWSLTLDVTSRALAAVDLKGARSYAPAASALAGALQLAQGQEPNDAARRALQTARQGLLSVKE